MATKNFLFFAVCNLKQNRYSENNFFLQWYFRVNTDHKQFCSEKWLKSKRLIYGSLICLSTTVFKEDILFATIAEKPKAQSTEQHRKCNFIHSLEPFQCVIL